MNRPEYLLAKARLRMEAAAKRLARLKTAFADGQLSIETLEKMALKLALAQLKVQFREGFLSKGT